MMNRRMIASLLMGVLALYLNGCAAVLVGGAAVGAGAGTVAYIKGELKAEEEVTLTRAFKAALATMKELEFVVSKDEKDSFNATVEGFTVADKRVRINMERMSENITEVKIRIGTFGDETLSRIILKKMEERF